MEVNMTVKLDRRKIGPTVSRVSIPPEEWSDFLENFSRKRRGWRLQLETHDVVTNERVISRPMELQSIELDLEDKKNPRININVHYDNKLIKHILFRPSRLILQTSHMDGMEILRVDSVNTNTGVRLRRPA
jgi:uncharacterized protein Smg (DUF494 family)